MIHKEPFKCWIRRDGTKAASVVFRFEVDEGKGILGLRLSGRQDPEPSAHYEAAAILAEHLRGGRFVHVLISGQRQSYALARITEEVAVALPVDAWVELVPHSEYGFRYLLVPEAGSDQAEPTAAPAASAPRATAAAPVDAPPAARAPRAARSEPKAGRKAVPSGGLPAPPATVPVNLAEAALRALSHDQTLALLRDEMGKMQLLYGRVQALEHKLTQSQARERDLVELLERWRAMDDSDN